MTQSTQSCLSDEIRAALLVGFEDDGSHNIENEEAFLDIPLHNGIPTNPSCSSFSSLTSISLSPVLETKEDDLSDNESDANRSSIPSPIVRAVAMARSNSAPSF